MFSPKSKIARAACVAGLSLSLVGGVCAPAVQALAADGGHTVTVTSAQTHAYKLIKLFDGSFTTDADGRLHMGEARVSDEAVAKVLRNTLNTYAHDPKWETATDQQLADGIASLSEDEMQAFANSVAAGNVGGENYTPLASSTGSYVVGTAAGQSGTAILTAPSDGYYLIVSDPSSVWGKVGESGTQAVLTPVAGDTTAATKTEVPVLVKTVADNFAHDPDGREDWDKGFTGVSDFDIHNAGDIANVKDVRYKVEVSLPDIMGDMDSYPVTVHSTLGSGLKFGPNAKESWVSATLVNEDGSKTVPIQFSSDNISILNAVDGVGDEMVLDFGDVRKVLADAGVTPSEMGGYHIEYVYNGSRIIDGAEGNLDALLGSRTSLADPLVSTAYATYKPYTYGFMGGETNKTVEDQAKLYSYSLKVDKVDGDAEALKGAKFTLTEADGTVIGKDITAADDGTFTFTGLDSGVEYTLTETQVPAGHKAIDPIKFKISATVSAEGDAITAISATETADPSNAATFTVDDATVVATVVNLSGPQMPVTGMAGIAGGILAGGVLIAVSGVKLARTKKDSEDSE